jgi:ParB family transcriptional regulator, chromosome partitioning protein
MEPLPERRTAAADGDTSAIRRSLIQHLTASGKLLQAVFALDREHLGSRFSDMDQGDPADPFHEIGVATTVVQALGERLAESGGGLTAALEARQAEVDGLRGQLRDLQESTTVQARISERQIAEARAQAERELDSRRADLAEVRSLAVDIIRLGEEVEATRPAGPVDQLRESLAALREAVKTEHTVEEITVACDAVLLSWFALARERAPEIPAAEARSSDRLKSNEVIRALEEQVAQARAQAQGSANDAARARAELAGLDEARRETARERERAKEAAKAHETVLNQAMEVIEQGRKRERQLLADLDKVKEAQDSCTLQVSETKAISVKLARERDDVTAQLEQSRESAKQAAQKYTRDHDELAAATKERDLLRQRLSELIRKAEAALDKSAREYDDLKRQFDAQHEQLASLRAAARERDDYKRQLDTLSSGRHDAEQKAHRDHEDLKRQADAARAAAANLQAANSAMAKERDELRAKIDDLKRGAEHAAGKGVQEKLAYTQELTALRDGEAKLRSQIAAGQAERARMADRLEQLDRELAQTREHSAGRAREHAQLVEQLRLKESQARDHARGTTAELSHVKDSAARNDQELRLLRDKLSLAQEQLERERAQAEQQKNDWEATLESSKLVSTTITSERDRLRREVERLNGEFNNIAKHAEERENQLTLRLTEVSRQLGELKQQHHRVSTASQKDAAGDVVELQARLKQLEQELASERRSRYEAESEWERRFSEFKQLLSDAREAVLAVKRRATAPQ